MTSDPFRSLAEQVRKLADRYRILPELCSAGAPLLADAVVRGAFADAEFAALRAIVERGRKLDDAQLAKGSARRLGGWFEAAWEWLAEHHPTLRCELPPMPWGTDEGRALCGQLVADAIDLEAERLPSGSTREQPPALEDGAFSAAELAEHYGLSRDRVRKRLERWRLSNDQGWHEDTESRSREPKYFYRLRDVRAILEDMWQQDRRTVSAERPS